MAAAPHRTIILDTAPLLAGLGPAQGAGGPATEGTVRWVVPSAVRAEVRPGGPTGRALERALSAGLEVVDPSPDARRRVHEAMTRRGETDRVAAADQEVLALALDLAVQGPVEVWSDDYAVQNLGRTLELVVRPVLTPGIRTEATWYVRCTGCARYPEHAAEGDTCPVCGSPLKRTRKGPRTAR